LPLVILNNLSVSKWYRIHRVLLFEDICKAGSVPSSENYIQWYDWSAKKTCREKIGRGELPFLQAISPIGKARFRKYENFWLGL
jgi:hypothetical protein